MQWLTQDALENCFGSIRAHGQSNIMPDTAAFVSAYKTLLLNNITSNYAVSGNCQNDKSLNLCSIKLYYKITTIQL